MIDDGCDKARRERNVSRLQVLLLVPQINNATPKSTANQMDSALAAATTLSAMLPHFLFVAQFCKLESSRPPFNERLWQSKDTGNVQQRQQQQSALRLLKIKEIILTGFKKTEQVPFLKMHARMYVQQKMTLFSCTLGLVWRKCAL